MSFLEDLRSFLRQPVIVSDAELESYRQHALATLEQAERAGKPREWLDTNIAYAGGMLAPFASRLTRELAAMGMPRDAIPDLVKAGLSRRLEVAAPLGSTVHDQILREALFHAPWAAEKVATFEGEWAPVLDETQVWEDLSAYAREIRAIQVRDDRVLVTPIGRALRDLVGIQAIRWLLHVEVALSTGSNDPWRIDRSTAVACSEHPFQVARQSGSSFLGDNRSTVARMWQLELLEGVESSLPGLVNDFQLCDHARPLFRELAQPEGRPWPSPSRP